MVAALDTVDNDFLTEAPTVEIEFETLAETNARWRAELARRPTVNLRPPQSCDAQAVTTRMEVVRP